MSILEGVGFQFKESMSGYIGVGVKDPIEEAKVGKADITGIRFTVEIKIVDMHRFLEVAEQEAELSGQITFGPLGGTFTIRDGRFNLFTLDATTGMRQMVYDFKFKAKDGQIYFLHGHKDIHDDPGMLDVVGDMTRLFTTIYSGEDDQAPVYGAGEMYFNLKDTPALVKSMRTVGHASLSQKAAVYAAFTSFAWGALRDEYLKHLRLFYDTRYENLVLSGTAQGDDGPRPFFLISGEHDKGFPWGDGETFSDVILAIGDGHGGYERFCITNRVLPGLRLDVDHGGYTYRGPLFAIKTGYAASFLQMHTGAAGLIKCEADFKIEFEAKPYETVTFPFETKSKLVRMLTKAVKDDLNEVLPSEQPLGMFITPHRIKVKSGQLHISTSEGSSNNRKLSINVDNTSGEAERSIFRNLKEPTLLYGYICALRPQSRVARVQTYTSTLRHEREQWEKDIPEKFLGAILSRVASNEILMEGDNPLSTKPLKGVTVDDNLFKNKLGDPVIEVNNDHFPTAVFQRRIIRVRDPSGEECLALEEDMRLMRLDPKNSDRKVTVASVWNERDKKAALYEVLDKTNFDAVVKERLAATGKSAADFSIVIKPNFMFGYNRDDRTTFTDPELVAHLVRRLRAAGFENIAVVEAQNTYGEHFERRSVPEVAAYLGYDGAGGYHVVDLTKETLDNPLDKQYLGEHPVPRTWRDADFRISFAKNKTHSYAHYTLTLKNVYGALPLANKFKEYHCMRDIYYTTTEYLRAFPVHFGLVDAYVSADGPFGIFADPRPNVTNTIIGGADLVAVDWVGASKMGIDPMISQYMRLAVDVFGKPEIDLTGYRQYELYRPWLNVPEALTLFAGNVLDKHYRFGNLFYMSAANMDEKVFPFKNRSLYVRVLRRLTMPLRRALFVMSDEPPSLLNRKLNQLLCKLGF